MQEVEVLAWFEEQRQKLQNQLYPDSLSLHSACRYALDGQGKRIRPLLCFGSAFALSGDYRQALMPALALEWIHTYSLVHDDLPCMDDDALRRGRATTHIAYDEATALLVGDALLTDAFALLLMSSLSDASKVAMTRELTRAAGGRGMVLGQNLDMEWTQKQGYQKSDLDRIHQHKTGHLIRASCVLGALTYTEEPTVVTRLAEFGEKLGLAFQIIDDCLDNSKAIGKSQGKDLATGKLTYLSVMSEDQALTRAQELTDQAMGLLQGFGQQADFLRQLALQLLQRRR